MSGGAFLADAFLPIAFLTDASTVIVVPPSDLSVTYLSPLPRFKYGTSGDLTFDLPSTAYDYSLSPIGGDIEADSGMRAAFIVRRDSLFTFTLRFREHLWSAVQAFLDFAQTGVPFRWYPDARDPSVSFIVQLTSPAIGSTYQATAHPDYPRVQLLTITVVKGSSTPPVIIPPPPTIDRTAEPYLFLQRGKGYWQDRDGSKATPAADGDLVYTWEDQWIHHRDGEAYSADFEGTDLRSKREGNELHFGIGAFSAPGAGSGRTLIRFNSIALLNELHLMVGIRSALDPPPSTSRTIPFSLGPTSALSSTQWPDINRHIWVNFGFDVAFDLGVLGIDLTKHNVLSVSASNFTRQIVIKINNVHRLTYDLIGSQTVGWAPGFGYVGSFQAIGMGGLGWDGWFRDVFMATKPMTASQELAWFNYMRGAVSVPPLPLLP
jgi:hypothetical protein